MKKISKSILKKREKRRLKREHREKWDLVRKNILVRDNYECQVCHQKIKNLKGIAVHHIIPREFKELFFDENNLITLCSRHHKWDKYSAHLNSLWFSEFFKKNFPERYGYLIKNTKMKKLSVMVLVRLIAWRRWLKLSTTFSILNQLF